MFLVLISVILKLVLATSILQNANTLPTRRSMLPRFKSWISCPYSRRFRTLHQSVTVAASHSHDDQEFIAPNSFPNFPPFNSQEDKIKSQQYISRIKDLDQLFNYDLQNMYQLSTSNGHFLNHHNFLELLFALSMFDNLPIDNRPQKIVEMIGYGSLNKSVDEENIRAILHELKLFELVQNELIRISTKSVNAFGETNEELLKTLAFGLFGLMTYAPDDLKHLSLMKKIMTRLIMTNQGGAIRKFFIYAVYHIPAFQNYGSQTHDLYVRMLLTATSSSLISAWLREEYGKVKIAIEYDFTTGKNKAVSIATQNNQLMWLYQKVFNQNGTKLTYSKGSSWWDNDIYDIPSRRVCFFFFNSVDGGVAGIPDYFSQNIQASYKLEEC